MSIKDRLAKKSEGLLVPDRTVTVSGAPLRTGPGQMLMVNSLMRESNEKVAALEEQLKEFEGIIPVRQLDSQSVLPSKWANRAASSFTSPEFALLKAEIEQAGGNIQPIKVRPLPDGERFEIVFGHRRHRACAELGLPVAAVVEELSEQELFRQMDRENRTRADLSPWEQGCMYRCALNDRLFSSIGELARELGLDKGNVSKALRLADLPKEVVAAFPSQLELQYRWGKLLGDALEIDRHGVLERARMIANSPAGRTSAKVLDELLGRAMPATVTQEVRVGGKLKATIETNSGRVAVRFAKDALSTGQMQELESYLTQLLK